MDGPIGSMKGCSRRFVGTFLALALPCLSGSGNGDTHRGKATPLTSVGAVSNLDAPVDPDDPGVGGSFDTSTYFRNRLTSAAAIAACASIIEKVATAWAQKFSLARAFRELHPTGLTLQYVRGDLQGLFEFKYKVELQTHARVSLNFYSQDGSMLDPASIQSFLTRYKIGQLEDSLDEALRCGNRAP